MYCDNNGSCMLGNYSETCLMWPPWNQEIWPSYRSGQNKQVEPFIPICMWVTFGTKQDVCIVGLKQRVWPIYMYRDLDYTL